MPNYGISNSCLINRHHANNRSDVAAEDHVEGSDETRQSGGRTPPARLQIFDRPISSSPTQAASPLVSESDQSLTPVTPNPLRAWLQHTDDLPLGRRTDGPGSVGSVGAAQRARDRAAANADNTLLGSSHQPETSRPRDGLQTPKTWTPGSVTPCASVDQQAKGSASEPSDGDRTPMDVSPLASHSASPRSGSPMSDIHETPGPSTAERDSPIEPRADDEDAEKGPQSPVRYRRYVAGNPSNAGVQN